VTHASRWIELTGAHNVRDLAGLPATGGRRVRPGVLLRGDHVDALTGPDLAVLRDEVGLRAVIDLRTTREAPAAREWVGTLGLTRLHLPLVDLTGTTSPRRVREELGDDVGAIYRRMLAGAGPNLVRILEFLVEDGHTPALVHCAAGKDRTGITVAVLLAAAGVEEPGIVADYVATGERLDRVRAALAQRELYRQMGQDSSPAAVLESAAIEAVLDTVKELGGGAAGFLIAQGADPSLVTRWRDLLLELDN
jgi:protein-tyrosine phosphatase